jgi:ubiquitin carboxyl-terminal hydrolase 4/11/15
LPLGGKTFEKIEEARRKPARASPTPEPITVDPQLPTPPDERSYVIDRTSGVATLENRSIGLLRPSGSEGWPTPRSNLSNAGSSSSSPPRLDDIELPNFEDSQYEDSTSLDPLMLTSQQFDYPDPSSKASPTSSDEVEPDIDDERDGDWREQQFEDGMKDGDTMFPVPQKWSRTGSPAGSNNSDTDPFSDANVQKGDDHRDSDDIPIQTILNANE